MHFSFSSSFPFLEFFAFHTRNRSLLLVYAMNDLFIYFRLFAYVLILRFASWVGEIVTLESPYVFNGI